MYSFSLFLLIMINQGQLFQEQVFEHTDFTMEPMNAGDYESCTFVSCRMQGADLKGARFFDCRFKSCDFSMAALEKSAWRNCFFEECKMLGLRFDQCNPLGFSVSFDHCQLDHSLFTKLKMRKTIFRNSRLHNVDFSACDLCESDFSGSDLLSALFYQSNLEKAIFVDTNNLQIDPEVNRLRKARFSAESLPGLLGKYQIDIV